MDLKNKYINDIYVCIQLETWIKPVERDLTDI